MYGKLFASMYGGTLGTKGPWQALVTFQQLIILADRAGVVDHTPEYISRVTTIPLDIINLGIQHLLEPDPASRSPAEDGRRIVPLSETRPWGWRIVNYEQYRRIRSQDERREYMRQYQQDRRKKLVNNGKQVNRVNTGTPIAEAVSSKQKADKRAAPLPIDFELTEKRRDYATEKGVLSPEVEFEAFCAHHQAHGKLMKDWDAAWRTWCLNYKKFSRTGGSNETGRNLSAVDRVRKATRERAEQDGRAPKTIPQPD